MGLEYLFEMRYEEVVRQNIDITMDRLQSREVVENLSREELVALFSVLIDLLQAKQQEIQDLRQEYEARLETLSRTFEARIDEMQLVINDLKRKLNTNSTNSGIPPSKDPIGFDRSSDKDDKDENDGANPPATGKQRRRGGQKGHKGHGVHFYTPDGKVKDIHPERCTCGCKDFVDERPFLLHQLLELPHIFVEVIHYQLFKGRCRNCGKWVKARLPAGCTTGFGPRLTSLVGILYSTMGSSARQIASFFSSGLFVTRAGECVKLPVSMVMKLRERCSNALKPHHEAIGEVARVAPINHVDETSWPTFGPEGKRKNWLWVMVSGLVSFFMIHAHRSQEAFHALIGDWQGILVSDDYALYCKWDAEDRQSCLAHLIRAAKKLSEDPDRDIAKWGAWLLKELRCLAQMSKKGPTRGEWQAWVMRMKRLVHSLKDRDDSLGNLVSRLEKHFDSLYTFLRVPGVDSTNNRAERTLRPAVVRRKVSYGSTDECGLRWTERMHSVLMTCKLNSWSFADLMHGAVKSLLYHEPEDLSRYSELKQLALEARAQMRLEIATP